MQRINQFFQILLTPLRWLLDLFGKIIPGLKSGSQMTAPILAGVLTFIFLLTIQISFLVVARSMKDSAQFGNYLSKLWISIPLIIIAPLVVYFFVRLLLAGEKSRFPDLDASWKAGLAALKENGIDLQNTPIFVVLGVRDSLLPTRLMTASSRQFDVENVYGEAPSLQWYANHDEIYIFCRRAGTLSLLSQKFEKSPDAPSNEAGNSQILGTIVPGELSDPDSGAKHQPAFDVTALPGQLDTPEARPMVGTGTLDASVAHQIAGGSPKPNLKSEQQKAPKLSLSNKDLEEYESRLSHVCKLLNDSRLPICPINGLITTMGFSIVEQQPDTLANQVRTDLNVVLDELKVNCAVTNIVTDLDTDEGGIELANRLGSQFKDRRFGKGNRVWNDPTIEQMRALSVNATGSFELWIHKLFQDPNSLKTNEVFGNRKLFRLLCRTIVALQPGLDTVLSNGFGIKSSDVEDDHIKFAGCYFTGIGATDENRFFVKGVFDRITDGAGELEWSQSVYKKEELLGFVGNISLVLGVVSLGGLIWMIAF